MDKRIVINNPDRVDDVAVVSESNDLLLLVVSTKSKRPMIYGTHGTHSPKGELCEVGVNIDDYDGNSPLLVTVTDLPPDSHVFAAMAGKYHVNVVVVKHGF